MTNKQNFAKDINVPSKEQTNDSLKNQDKNFNENFTQEKEQIIIDGIIVTDCNYIIAYDPPEWQGNWGGAIHRGACKIYSKDCKYNPDCYFKQLVRKTQECEELRVAYNKAQDIIGRVNGANELKSYSLQESIKECDSYRKALEDIEEIVKSLNENRMCFYDDINDCSNCDMNTDCNYLRKSKILDIINKAKGLQYQ